MTGAIALQRFKTIARRDAEVIKRNADLKLSNLPQSNTLKGSKLLDPNTHSKVLGISVFIGCNYSIALR